MNPRLHLIETNLKRTAARWRWLAFFLTHSATLGAIVCLPLSQRRGGFANWLDTAAALSSPR